MMPRFLKCAAAAFAMTFFATSTPLSAAPLSIRGFAAQQVRLATIAYRLNEVSANDCARPQMLTGMLLHDLSQYDPAVRAAVSRAFSLNDGFGVLQIVPGSVADRAGLAIDDEIVAVQGLNVEDRLATSRGGKSYRRMEGFLQMLQVALQQGPVTLLVRRANTTIRILVAGERGCGGELSFLNSGEENAWSDGRHVAVTTGMMQLARSDDELAFVLAHEMSHNILGHSDRTRSGIFGGRRSEIDADQMAVRLMSAAGYQPQAGVTFLSRAQRRYWWSISLDHPSFGSRIRAVTTAMSVLPTWQSPNAWQVAAAETHYQPTGASLPRR